MAETSIRKSSALTAMLQPTPALVTAESSGLVYPDSGLTF